MVLTFENFITWCTERSWIELLYFVPQDCSAVSYQTFNVDINCFSEREKQFEKVLFALKEAEGCLPRKFVLADRSVGTDEQKEVEETSESFKLLPIISFR